MPSAAEILAGLTAIATDAIVVAIAWHVVLALALIALARGWRPSRRAAGALVALPLASVAAFAIAFGNPFNGAMFAAGTVALIAMAWRDERGPVARGPAWAWWAGVAMIGFGWVYPHFLPGHPATYLYAAPVGLVPCPTLSVAIGLALLAGGLGTRPWRLTLAGLGLCYGVFGVARLGVSLDLGLLAGALVLVACRQRTGHRARGGGMAHGFGGASAAR